MTSTLVPIGPRIREVETSEATPAIDLPSTSVITSPSLRPASSAGVSGNTRLTRRPSWTSDTLSPTPANCPDVCSLKIFSSSAVK